MAKDLNVSVSSIQHGGVGSGCCRFCDPQGAKAQWIEKLLAKREEHGYKYSKREQDEYRAMLETKYAAAPDSAFEGR